MPIPAGMGICLAEGVGTRRLFDKRSPLPLRMRGQEHVALPGTKKRHRKVSQMYTASGYSY